MNLSFIIPTSITLLLAGFNAAMFLVIKINDMKHLEDANKRIEKKLEEMDDKLDSQGERIACLEGKLKARRK